MESGKKEVTYKSKIKDLLEAGARISVGSVWRILRTTEARHFIAQLKKEGLNILSEWVTKGDNRFKEYWLAPKN